ncbi:hypothetical protein HKX48_006283 [Thoreauomyces humboldtii]|nr:hypothetical protein HKX48_006283 [Thoreauomyces humboldtii]
MIARVIGLTLDNINNRRSSVATTLFASRSRWSSLASHLALAPPAKRTSSASAYSVRITTLRRSTSSMSAPPPAAAPAPAIKRSASQEPEPLAVKRPRSEDDTVVGGAGEEATTTVAREDPASAIAIPDTLNALITTRKVLKEVDVGITTYMSKDLSGFTGILKSRITDFQVSEVLRDGTVVQLLSTDLPVRPPVKEESPAIEADQEAGFAEMATVIEDSKFMEDFKKLLENVKAYHLAVKEATANALARKKASRAAAGSSTADASMAKTEVESEPSAQPATPEKPAQTELPASLVFPVADKALRTSAHAIIRNHFGTWLDSQSSGEGDLELRPKPVGNNRGRGDQGRGNRGGHGGNWQPFRKTRKEQEAEGGQYTEFTLYKENKDTMVAISELCNVLHVGTKVFSYAGTKDKRACTSQKVAAKRIAPERLKGLNASLRGMSTGDYKLRKEQMTLGELGGNHFKIVLREVVPETTESSIDDAMRSLRDRGFVNYFGMQRFGTMSLPTYAPGVAYLKGMFKEAVAMIMEEKDGEREEITEARRHWAEHGDPAAALLLMPRHCLAERAILGYLKSKGRDTDHLGALESIPRNLKSMYVHAYQSLVWNTMATERLEKYGSKPVIGDLVISDAAGKDAMVVDDQDDAVPQPKNGQAVAIDINKDIAILETEEDCAKYTMADVVLPLPGFQVMYPKNSMGERYVSYMAEHGLDPHNMTRKHQTANLPGSYRTILAMPKDLKWHTLRYDEVDADLQLTDLQRVQNEPDIVSVPDGKYLAVIFEFTLASSQYATMALRECSKMDTSTGSHSDHARGNSNGEKKSGSPRRGNGGADFKRERSRERRRSRETDRAGGGGWKGKTEK